jgi:FAD/FMN-containing dehydrogenase
MRYQEKRRNTKLVGSHAARIAYVQGQLRASVASGLCSARPSRDQMTMRIVEYKKSAGIDLRQLDNVLEINAAGTAVAVEPGCIVLRLTSFLMARGYTLLVTPGERA